jgi:hypothetical protein
MSPIANAWARNTHAGAESGRPPARGDANYEKRLEERDRSRKQLNDDLAALESCLHRMEEANVDGVAQLKLDFAGAKAFIFDAVANSNVQALDIHIEFDDDGDDDETFDGLELIRRSVRTPPPPSPRMKPIPLPEITPGSTPKGWGRATPVGGLGFRIMATPRELGSEDLSYFCNIIPPTPLGGPKSPAIRSGASSRCQSRTQSYSNLSQPEGVTTPKANR